MIGSIAFGASAIGAYIKKTGATEDALLSNTGTFVGALGFLTAALLVLPGRRYLAASRHDYLLLRCNRIVFLRGRRKPARY
jgi:hypothetical protein